MTTTSELRSSDWAATGIQTPSLEVGTISTPSPIPDSPVNPSIHQSIQPRLSGFTDPSILAQIGHVRVPMFLKSFVDDLKAAGISLPEPLDPNEVHIPHPPLDSAQAIY